MNLLLVLAQNNFWVSHAQQVGAPCDGRGLVLLQQRTCTEIAAEFIACCALCLCHVVTAPKPAGLHVCQPPDALAVPQHEPGASPDAFSGCKLISSQAVCLAPADAYLVALTRSSGIVAGVVLMLLLSMIVFPKSASHQVRMLQQVSAVLWMSAQPSCVGQLSC